MWYNRTSIMKDNCGQCRCKTCIPNASTIGREPVTKIPVKKQDGPKSLTFKPWQPLKGIVITSPSTSFMRAIAKP